MSELTIHQIYEETKKQTEEMEKQTILLQRILQKLEDIDDQIPVDLNS
jgi:hypothetical protein